MTNLELLNALGIRTKQQGESHHVTAGWVGFDCPRCSPDSGKCKAGLPLQGPLHIHCWACGRLPLTWTLMEASGLPWGKVKELLEQLERFHGPIPDAAPGKLVIPAGLGPLLPAHRHYLLAERGIDPEQAEQVWGLQGYGPHPRLHWRLFLPVQRRGKVASWTTRSIGQRGLRYLSAGAAEEAWPHKKLLYGEQLAGHAVVICEGPLDALRTGPGAVATFGVDFTHAQVLLLAAHPVRVVCFDAEPIGQRAAESLCAILQHHPGTTINVVLSSGKDPGEADVRELAHLRRRFLR